MSAPWLPVADGATVVHEFLEQSARRAPGRVALVTPEVRLTYAQLDAAANRLAHALVLSGIGSGDRVAVHLDNRAEAVVAVFGILKAGAAFVMVNPGTRPDKLCYMLNDCAARAWIVDRRATDALAAVSAQVLTIRCTLPCGDAALSFNGALASCPERPVDRRPIDRDLAAIIYTSGSTGRPKGVVVTHANVLSAARSITEYLENRPDDVILNVLPLSFDYGLYQALMAARVGATLVLERSFAYPWRTLQRVKAEGVTGFPGVPTIFAMLLQMRDLDPADLDGVRYVTNTGAALPPAHLLRLRELFRRARVYSMYGVTECKRVSFLPPDQIDVRPASVGRGMPNEEVYVVDADGQPVGPGVVGELVVRGANVMQGYWGLPEETARALRPGRWPWERVLYTGDLFMTDDDGYLYFVSRKDDIIKSRGEKVSPREVESAICELPGVREAAVLGVPDEILGEAVVAVVVRADDMATSERDVMRHCTQRLEGFMCPKSVVFRDGLPRTANGKVDRRALAPLVSGGSS